MILDKIKKYILPIISGVIFFVSTILYFIIDTTPMSVIYMILIWVSIGIVVVYFYLKSKE